MAVNSKLIQLLLVLMGSFTSAEALHQTFKDNNGTFSSPSYPDRYPPNMENIWRFEAPVGMKIEITFDDIDLTMRASDSNCIDRIEVFDGSDESMLMAEPICSLSLGWPQFPTRFISSSNLLTVRMKTEDSKRGRGFRARYNHVESWVEYIAAIGVNAGVRGEEDPVQGGVTIVRFNRFRLQRFQSIDVPEATQPSALTYDVIGGFFYYTDIKKKFIGRVHVVDQPSDIIISDDVENPLGVAAAYLTGLLYWTDAGRDEVSVSRLDGLYRKTLVPANSGCVSPRGIALTPDHQQLYWSCKDRIEKSKADGSERQVFLDRVNGVISLFIHPEGQKLYWMSTSLSTGIVEEINLDGSNRIVLFHANGFAEFHDFVVDKSLFIGSYPITGKLYFGTTNSTFGSIHDPAEVVRFEGLYYVTSEAANSEPHQCAIKNGGCLALCFPDGLDVTCDGGFPTELLPMTTATDTKNNSSQTGVIGIVIPVVLVIAIIIFLLVYVTWYCRCFKFTTSHVYEEPAFVVAKAHPVNRDSPIHELSTKVGRG